MGFISRTFLPPKLHRALNPLAHAKYSARRKFVPQSVRKVQHYSNIARNPLGYAKRRASYSLSNRIRRALWK